MTTTYFRIYRPLCTCVKLFVFEHCFLNVAETLFPRLNAFHILSLLFLPLLVLSPSSLSLFPSSFLPLPSPLLSLDPFLSFTPPVDGNGVSLWLLQDTTFNTPHINMYCSIEAAHPDVNSVRWSGEFSTIICSCISQLPPILFRCINSFVVTFLPSLPSLSSSLPLSVCLQS